MDSKVFHSNKHQYAPKQILIKSNSVNHHGSKTSSLFSLFLILCLLKGISIEIRSHLSFQRHWIEIRNDLSNV
jgi:hypothetical protein